MKTKTGLLIPLVSNTYDKFPSFLFNLLYTAKDSLSYLHYIMSIYAITFHTPMCKMIQLYPTKPDPHLKQLIKKELCILGDNTLEKENCLITGYVLYTSTTLYVLTIQNQFLHCEMYICHIDYKDYTQIPCEGAGTTGS